MLKLKSSDANFQTYFALPYNPFGINKEDYNHHPPFKIFDMINDEVVLIGKDYWDLLGGRGTYEKILEIAGEIGQQTKKELKKFLS